MLQLLKPASPSCCSCAEGKACGGKRKGVRQSRASAEKAAKRRRLVGGMLKTVGAAAPGQQCTQCGTQVRPCPPAATFVCPQLEALTEGAASEHTAAPDQQWSTQVCVHKLLHVYHFTVL